ncbi:MAG: hypothetical protein U9O98_10295 [Asgard group archaeon]|nr:hypothetical protein [Asgard group archaeon]
MVSTMIQQESQTVGTTVFVQDQWLTLPQWLVEEASQRVIQKGIALLEKVSRSDAFRGPWA